MKSLSYGPEPYASANSAISANLSQQGKYPAKIYNILTFDFTQTWRDLMCREKTDEAFPNYRSDPKQKKLMHLAVNELEMIEATGSAFAFNIKKLWNRTIDGRFGLSLFNQQAA